MDNMIRVWRFEDAPDDYKCLSTNGGDEDWVAVVPRHMMNDYIPWLNPCTPFGICDVDVYDGPDGNLVYIGSHA